jgi:hypothetical protein
MIQDIPGTHPSGNVRQRRNSIVENTNVGSSEQSTPYSGSDPMVSARNTVNVTQVDRIDYQNYESPKFASIKERDAYYRTASKEENDAFRKKDAQISIATEKFRNSVRSVVKGIGYGLLVTVALVCSIYKMKQDFEFAKKEVQNFRENNSTDTKELAINFIKMLTNILFLQKY